AFDDNNAMSTKESPDGDGGERVAPITLQLLDANPARGVGVDALPGTVSYFVGDDPAAWRTGIPTYAGVRYEDVYPGIDLVFYGNPGELEYDSVVAPGGDPSRIVFARRGAEGTRLAPQGTLLIRTPYGEVHQRKPDVYQ